MLDDGGFQEYFSADFYFWFSILYSLDAQGSILNVDQDK